MYEVKERPRSGCALHGALQTIGELKGVVPIVHSNPGCDIQGALAGNASGAGRGYFCGEAVPSTDVQERHIIFGGASRLREQIKNTIKVVRGELYVVLGSCEAAMVGDDIEAMTREAYEQGAPVVCSLTAGFHGDSRLGYSSVMKDLLGGIQTVKVQEEVRASGRTVDGYENAKAPDTYEGVKAAGIEDTKENKRISLNVFGIIPHADPTFRGDLQEIRSLLSHLGFAVNTFFGTADAVRELRRAHEASLSLVFSKWGILPAEYLKEKSGVPYLALTHLPSGYGEVERLARTLFAELDRLGLPGPKQPERFLEREREKAAYYYHSVAEELYRLHIGGNAIVGDEARVLQYGSFLKDYLGVSPKLLIVTDGDPGAGQDGDYAKRSDALLHRLSDRVIRSGDGREIGRALLHSDAELILASSLERSAAEKLGVPMLELSYPVYQKAFVNKTYVSVNGGSTLLADLLTMAYRSRHRTERRLLEDLVRAEA